MKNKRGQMITAEYIVIFFMAIGAIVAMSVFVQRALQGRIRDARSYMINEAKIAYQGNIYFEYEPYYGNTTTSVARDQRDDINILEGGITGVFIKTINQQVGAQVASEQAPPMRAE